MTYEETLNFLYSRLPMFQRIGSAAYKVGLDTSLALAQMYDNPQRAYHTIHVAGTNGKGSTSHSLAAILQQSGYKVGLYTSPHLMDFRERIRVNGEKISKDYVIGFVKKYIEAKSELTPSFFELTMMMAFDYFRAEKVDIAVIEVGLGGRLDSTNIINPDLSIITNISFDHTQFLGDTLPKIASEKAGIIKPNTPVVIGSADGDVRRVFEEKARKEHAKIIFAQGSYECKRDNEGYWQIDTSEFGTITAELQGECQAENCLTIINAVKQLLILGYEITPEAVREGFAHVCMMTGLMGRWMKIGDKPLRICDTGHNVGGITHIVEQLQKERTGVLRIIIGFVNDKDVTHIFEMMPKDAVYYFTQAQLPRALDAEKVKEQAGRFGLQGDVYACVSDAYNAATEQADEDDFIYIGGSTFIVADLLAGIDYECK